MLFLSDPAEHLGRLHAHVPGIVLRQCCDAGHAPVAAYQLERCVEDARIVAVTEQFVDQRVEDFRFGEVSELEQPGLVLTRRRAYRAVMGRRR